MPWEHSRFLPSELKSPRIGFGTSGLMGSALTTGGRLRLLNLAYDLGIRHFDTAPLYGMGEAEKVLGMFVQGKRESVTLATKYGLFPPLVPRYYKFAAPAARALYHRSRILKSVLDGLISPGSGKRKEVVVSFNGPQGASNVEKVGPYDADDMEKMLDKSLCQIKTDYIDCYLLHECSKGQINDEVIVALDRFVTKGKIRSYGVATGRTTAKEILKRYPEQAWIVQIEHTVFHPKLDIASMRNAQGTITHGALNRACRRLQAHLSDSTTERRWSDALAYDMAKPNSITELLLTHAMLENDKGIVLFSSRKPENIKANAKVIAGPKISPKQIAVFTGLVQTELYSRI